MRMFGQFAICTSPILFFLSPKILHNLCFVFLLGITVVQREIKDNVYSNFWGAKKVYYGRCENGQ